MVQCGAAAEGRGDDRFTIFDDRFTIFDGRRWMDLGFGIGIGALKRRRDGAAVVWGKRKECSSRF